MQAEKFDILADQRKQRGQLLKMLSIYCRNHRMLEVNLGGLAPSAIDKIANEVVDLFVDRVQQYEKKTPPPKGANIGDEVPGSRGRSRG